MRRRLFSITTLLSLVLCVATVVLWVRSYWYGDRLSYFWRGDQHSLQLAAQSRAGELQLGRQTIKPALLPFDLRASGWRYSSTVPRARDALKSLEADGWGSTTSRWFLGFGFLNSDHPRWGLTVQMIVIPLWFLAVLLAILPAWRLGALARSRQRGRAGFCCACGYDLRATPERCPECGTVPAARNIRTYSLSKFAERGLG